MLQLSWLLYMSDYVLTSPLYFSLFAGRNWASLFVPMIMAGKVSEITTIPVTHALDCQSPSTFTALPSPRFIQNHLSVSRPCSRRMVA